MHKSTVGGVLSIVAGALGLLSGLLLAFFGVFFGALFNNQDLFTASTAPPDQFVTFLTITYAVMGVFYIGIGVLSIVGGIFSLQRKHWGWALAGAIGGTLSFLPVGVAAVVLVAMGRSEFNAAPSVQPAASAPGTV